MLQADFESSTQPVNLSFKGEVFPSLLKVAEIIPIKKKVICLINNCRLVSILPVFSKIFEALFLNRMVFFKEPNQISGNQFVFMKSELTKHAVVSPVSMVVEEIEWPNSTNS